jgi:hypothetical protein
MHPRSQSPDATVAHSTPHLIDAPDPQHVAQHPKTAAQHNLAQPERSTVDVAVRAVLAPRPRFGEPEAPLERGHTAPPSAQLVAGQEKRDTFTAGLAMKGAGPSHHLGIAGAVGAVPTSPTRT